MSVNQTIDNFEMPSSKGVSDLEARLDYSYHHAKSCENLNFCFPAQTELFYSHHLEIDYYVNFLGHLAANGFQIK